METSKIYLWCVCVILVSRGYSIQPKPLHTCEAKVQYVEVNKHYRFDPYIVALHRCTGKNMGSSISTVCVAKTYENVTFHVFDLLNQKQPQTQISLQNHTSCHEQCKYDRTACNKYQTWQPADCKCTCNVVGKLQCDEGMYWDPFHCACRCPRKKENVDCGKYRVFSEDVCACVCKPNREGRCNRKSLFLHPDTCQCVPMPVNTAAQEALDCDDNGVISKTGVVIVAVVEAFLIVVGYVLWLKYCSRKSLCMLGKKDPAPWNDITIDRYSTDTPTIEFNPGLSVMYTSNSNPKKQNNNMTTKTSSSSHDALLNERSTENLHDESLDSVEWHEECGSMTKV